MNLDRDLLVRIATAIGIAVGGLVLGLLVRSVLLRWVLGLVKRTPTEVDEMIVEAIRPRVPWWFAAAGVTIAARIVDLPPEVRPWVDRVVQAAVILSAAGAVSSFLTRFVSASASRFPDAIAATTLSQRLIRVSVLSAGLLLAANRLGISILPVLTALGVGSVAVALALQPTLSNLFAGFHIIFGRMVRVGDFVELESGQQGFVSDVGWRNTRIRELANNVVVVPNSRMTQIIVRNYAFPQSEQSVVVEVGVSYDSDLERVEQETLAVAREVLREAPGAVPEFEPLVRFHTFGDSAVGFSVILRVRGFTDRGPVTHAFVKRLHRRFGELGIEIPFPQRVVRTVASPPPAAPTPEAP
jgi:small-conductance mechanosensitive channel